VKVVDSLQMPSTTSTSTARTTRIAILTPDVRAAETFVAGVDSGNVMVKLFDDALSDAGVYGPGAEIGISTELNSMPAARWVRPT